MADSLSDNATSVAAESSRIEVLVMGSGTSAGVPMIGCHCPVCHSADPRDTRSRPSIAVSYGGTTVLVDTTPELRMQAVANRLDRIDAVVFTHAHADHIFGLDDVRRYNAIMGGPLPLYANAGTMESLMRVFPYAFKENPDLRVFRPSLTPHEITGPFVLGGKTWRPVPLPHGHSLVLGFRIGDFAYCTDCSKVPLDVRPMLRGLDVLIIDALRPKPHPTHMSFAEALAVIEDLRPRRAYFTHLTHDVAHADIEKWLPPGVFAAHDGMRLNIE